MRKTENTENMNAVLLNRETLYQYLNAGRRVAERIAEEAGAVRRFGRTVRYYKPAIDEYLSNYQLNKEEK